MLKLLQTAIVFRVNRQLKRFLFLLAVFFALATADITAQMASPYGPGPGGVGQVNIGVTQAYPTHNVARPANWNANVAVSIEAIEVVECATSTNGALVKLRGVRVGNPGGTSADRSPLYATGGLATNNQNAAAWDSYLNSGVHDAYWFIIVPSGGITTRRYRLRRDPTTNGAGNLVNPYSLVPSDDVNGDVYIRYPTNTQPPCQYSPTMQIQSYNCTSRPAGSGSLGTAPYGPANEVAICGTTSATTLIRNVGNWGANPTTGAFQIGNYVINTPQKDIDLRFRNADNTNFYQICADAPTLTNSRQFTDMSPFTGGCGGTRTVQFEYVWEKGPNNNNPGVLTIASLATGGTTYTLADGANRRDGGASNFSNFVTTRASATAYASTSFIRLPSDAQGGDRVVVRMYTWNSCNFMDNTSNPTDDDRIYKTQVQTAYINVVSSSEKIDATTYDFCYPTGFSNNYSVALTYDGGMSAVTPGVSFRYYTTATGGTVQTAGLSGLTFNPTAATANPLAPTGSAANRTKTYWFASWNGQCEGERTAVTFRVRDDISEAPVIESSSKTVCANELRTYSIKNYSDKIPAGTGDDVTYVWWVDAPPGSYTITNMTGATTDISFDGTVKNPVVKAYRLWSNPTSNPPTGGCPPTPDEMPAITTAANICKHCFSAIDSYEVTVNAAPEASLSIKGGGTSIEVCGNEPVTLVFNNLSGSTGTYNITVSAPIDPSFPKSYPGVTEGYEFTVTPPAPVGTNQDYTYRIESVSSVDNSCLYIPSGNTVTVTKRPLLDIAPAVITTVPDPLCENEDFEATLAGITMTPVSQLVWTYNSTTYTGTYGAYNITIPKPPGAGSAGTKNLSVRWQYTTAAAIGGYCASATHTEPVTVTRGPSVTVVSQNLSPICEGDDPTVALSFEGGVSGNDYEISWAISGTSYSGTSTLGNAATQNFPIPNSTYPLSGGSYTFTINSVTQAPAGSCSAPTPTTNNTANITIVPKPTANFVPISMPTCENLPVATVIRLTGSPNNAYTIEYEIEYGGVTDPPDIITTEAVATPYDYPFDVPLSYIKFVNNPLEVHITNVSQTVGALTCSNADVKTFTISIEQKDDAIANYFDLDYSFCGEFDTPTKSINLKGYVPPGYEGSWFYNDPSGISHLETQTPNSDGTDDWIETAITSSSYGNYNVEWRIWKTGIQTCYSSDFVNISFTNSPSVAEVFYEEDEICYNLTPPITPYTLLAVPPTDKESGYWDIWGIDLDNGAPAGVSGGIKWEVSAGALPDGLKLDENTGIISGRPATSTSGMTYTFNVTITNLAGLPESFTGLTIYIDPGTPSGGVLPDGQINTSYTANLNSILTVTLLPGISPGWGSITSADNYRAAANVKDYGTYYFIWNVVGGCGSDNALTKVTFRPKPEVDPIGPLTFCAEDEIEIDEFEATDPTTNSPITTGTYRWSFEGKVMSTFATQPNGIGYFPTGKHAPAVVSNPSEEYKIGVEVYAGICWSEKMIIPVELRPKPAPVTFSRNVLCEGEDVTMGVGSNLWQDTKYEWTYSDNGSPTGVVDRVIDKSVGAGASGKYATGEYNADEEAPPYSFRFKTYNGTSSPVIANFNVTATVNGCESDAANLSLTVNPRPILTAPPDITECPQDAGVATTIDAIETTVDSSVDNTNFTWTWSGGTNTPGFTFPPVGNSNSLGDFELNDNVSTGKTGGVLTVKGETYGCESEAVSFEIWVKPRPNINAPASQSLCPEFDSGSSSYGGSFESFTFRSSNLADDQVDYNWTIAPPPPSLPLGVGTGSTPSSAALEFADNTSGSTVSYIWTVVAEGAVGSPADGCESTLATPLKMEVYPRPIITIDNPNVPICSGNDGQPFEKITFTANTTVSNYSWNISQPPSISDGEITTGAAMMWGSGNLITFNGLPLNTAEIITDDFYTATITVNATSTDGCASAPTEEYLTILQAPVMNIPDDVELCSEDSYPDTGTDTFSTKYWNGTTVLNYDWEIGNDDFWDNESIVGNAFSFDAARNNSDPAEKWITEIEVWAENTAALGNGCKSDKVKFKLTVHPELVLTSSTADIFVCPDELVIIPSFTSNVYGSNSSMISWTYLGPDEISSDGYFTANPTSGGSVAPFYAVANPPSGAPAQITGVFEIMVESDWRETKRCESAKETITVRVNPQPDVPTITALNAVDDITSVAGTNDTYYYCHSAELDDDGIVFSSTTAGASYKWLSSDALFTGASEGTSNPLDFAPFNNNVDTKQLSERNTLISVRAYSAFPGTTKECPSEATDFEIRVLPIPQLSELLVDTVSCSHDNIEIRKFALHEEFRASNPTVLGQTEFEWEINKFDDDPVWTLSGTYPTLGPPPSSSNSIPIFSPEIEDGGVQRILELTVIPYYQTCQGVPKTVNIIINPRPKITIVNKPDEPICSGESFQTISFNSGTIPSTFRWEIPPPPSGSSITTGLPLSSFDGTNFYGTSSSISFGAAVFTESSTLFNGGDHIYSEELTMTATATATGCKNTEIIDLEVLQAPVLTPFLPTSVTYCSDIDITKSHADAVQFSLDNDAIVGTSNTSTDAYSWSVVSAIGDVWTTPPAPGASRDDAYMPSFHTANFSGPANREATISVKARQRHEIDPGDPLAIPTPIEPTYKWCESKNEEFKIIVRPKLTITTQTVTVCPGETVLEIEPIVNKTDDAQEFKWVFTDDLTQSIVDSADPWDPTAVGSDNGTGSTPEFEAADNNSGSPLTGTFEFTVSYVDAPECESAPVDYFVVVNPTPDDPDITPALPALFCDGDETASVIGFTPAGADFEWSWTTPTGADDETARITGTGIPAKDVVSTAGSIPVFKIFNETTVGGNYRYGTGVVTITLSASKDGCPAAYTKEITLKVNPVAQMTRPDNISVCTGVPYPITVFAWDNSYFSIPINNPPVPADNFKWSITDGTWFEESDLSAAGSTPPERPKDEAGNLPAFTPGLPAGVSSPMTMTWSVTPYYNGCPGISQTGMTITINPNPVLTVSNATQISANEWEQERCSNESLFDNMTFESVDVPSGFTWVYSQWPGLWDGASGGEISSGIVIPGNANTVSGVSTVQSNSISFSRNPLYTSKAYGSPVPSELYSDDILITAAADVGGCVVEGKITLTVKQAPVMVQPDNILACSEETVIANAFAHKNEITGLTNYDWENKSSTIDMDDLTTTITTNTGTVSAPWTFTTESLTATQTVEIEVTAEHPTTLCPSDPVTFELTVRAIPVLTSSNTDKTVCSGGEVDLGAFITTPSGETTVRWVLGNIDILYDDDEIVNGTVITATNSMEGTGTIEPFTAAELIGAVSPISGVFSLYPRYTKAKTSSTTNPYCEVPSKTITVTVNPAPEKPIITTLPPLVFCDGTGTATEFTGAARILNVLPLSAGADEVKWEWTGDGGALNIGTNGSNNIPAFTINNTTVKNLSMNEDYDQLSVGKATVTLTPWKDGCVGEEETFDIIVNPYVRMKISNTPIDICSGESKSFPVFDWDMGLHNVISDPDKTYGFKWEYTLSGATFVDTDIDDGGVAGATSGTGQLHNNSGSSPRNVFEPYLDPSSVTSGVINFVVTPLITANGLQCPGATTNATVTVHPAPVFKIDASDALLITKRTCSGSSFLPIQLSYTGQKPDFTWSYYAENDIAPVSSGVGLASGDTNQTYNTSDGKFYVRNTSDITFLNNALFTTADTNPVSGDGDVYKAEVFVTAASQTSGCVSPERKVLLEVYRAPVIDPDPFDDIVVCSNADYPDAALGEEPILFKELSGEDAFVDKYTWTIGGAGNPDMTMWTGISLPYEVNTAPFEMPSFTAYANTSIANVKTEISVSAVHTYTIPATPTNITLNCSSTASFDYTVRPLPVLNTLNTTIDVCSGDEIDVSADFPALIANTGRVRWLFDNTDNIIETSTPDPYPVTGTCIYPPDTDFSFDFTKFTVSDNRTGVDKKGIFTLYPQTNDVGKLCEGVSRAITVNVKPIPEMPYLAADPTNQNPSPFEYCHEATTSPAIFTKNITWEIVPGSDNINLPTPPIAGVYSDRINSFTIQNNTTPSKYQIGSSTINVKYFESNCPSDTLQITYKVKPVVQIDPSYSIPPVCDGVASTHGDFKFDPAYSALHNGDVGTASDFKWEITLASHEPLSNLPQASTGFEYLPPFTPEIGPPPPPPTAVTMYLLVTPYYIDANNTCEGTTSAPLSITINPKPVITLTTGSAIDETRCSGTTPFNFIEFESVVPSNFAWYFPTPPDNTDIDTRVSNADKTTANIVNINGDDYFPGTGSRITFMGNPVYTTSDDIWSPTPAGVYEAEIIIKAKSVAAACEADDLTTTVTIKQAPVLASIDDIEACHNEDFDIPLKVTNATPLKEYKWTVSNTNVGLSDDVSSAPPPTPYSEVINYTATNSSSSDISAVVEITAEHTNGCISAPKDFNIKVRPTPVISPALASLDRCANVTVTAGVDLDLIQYAPTPTSMSPTLHWTLDDDAIFDDGGSLTTSGTLDSGGLSGTGNISVLETGNLTSSAKGTFTFTARIDKTISSGDLDYCESAPAKFEVNVFPSPVKPVLADESLFIAGTTPSDPPVLVTCIGSVDAIPVKTSTTTSGVKFTWKNTATDVIGLPAPQSLVPGTLLPVPPGPAGTQFDFPAFTATNANLTPAWANIEVTASITTSSGECSSLPLFFDIKVQPRAELGDWATPEICSEDVYVPADITDPTDPALFVFSSAFNGANGNPNADPAPEHFKWEVVGHDPTMFGTPALAASDAGYLPAFRPTGITGATATQLTLRVTPIWETCDGTAKDYTINLNPLPVVTPSYTSLSVCSGASFADIGLSLTPNISSSVYEWAIVPDPSLPATITTNVVSPAFPVTGGPITFGASSNTVQASYTATLRITATTPTPALCKGSTDVLLTINQAPVVDALPDLDICAENIINAINFATNPTTDVSGYTWTIDNPTVRGDLLAGADSLAMRKFTAKIIGLTDNNATVTVYAKHANGCLSLPEEFEIKVRRTPSLFAISSQELCPDKTVGPMTLSATFIPLGVDYEITWTLDSDDIIQMPSSFPASLTGSSYNVLPFDIPAFTTAAHVDDGSHTPLIGTFTLSGKMIWGTGANESCDIINPAPPIVITVNPTPEAPALRNGTNWNDKTLFCSDEDVLETHFISPTPDVTYSWRQLSGDLIGLPANSLDYIQEFVALNNTPGGVDEGVAVIQVSATSAKGCPGDTIINFSVKPIPQLAAYPPVVVCAGETFDGDAHPFEIHPDILLNYAPSGVTPGSFKWRISSGWFDESDLPDGGTTATPNWSNGNIDGVSDAGSFTFTPDTAKTGVYPNYYKPGSTTDRHPLWGATSTTMRMTVVPSYADCEGTPTQINVVINPLPITRIQLVSDPCLDAGATKIYMSNNGLPVSGSKYAWEITPDPQSVSSLQPVLFNEPDSMFFAAATFPAGMGAWHGVLSLTEKNFYGCKGQKVSMPIMILPMPDAFAGEPVEICFGDNKQLNAKISNETEFDMAYMTYEWRPFNIFLDYADAETNLAPWITPRNYDETIVSFRAVYTVDGTPYKCSSDWETTSLWALHSPESPMAPRVIVCESDDEMFMNAVVTTNSAGIAGDLRWQRLVETAPGTLIWDETKTVNIDNSDALTSLPMRDRVNHPNALPYPFTTPDDPFKWGKTTLDTTIYYQLYQIADISAPSGEPFQCKSPTAQTRLIINRSPETPIEPKEGQLQYCEDISSPYYTINTELAQGSFATTIVWYDNNDNYLGGGNSKLVNQPGYSYPDGGADDPFIFYARALSPANCESDNANIKLTVFQNPVLQYDIFDKDENHADIGCSPFEITAVNNSTNSDNVNYKWYWTDRTDDAPFESKINYTFYVDGTSVLSKKFNFEGVSKYNRDARTSEFCKTNIEESVRVSPGVIANFTTNQTDACHPAHITFTSASQTQGAYNFRWYWNSPTEPEFETDPTKWPSSPNGTIGPNPDWEFTNTGSAPLEYNVWLQADNSLCYDSKNVIITVYPIPSANFEMTNLTDGSICPPEPVEFSLIQNSLGTANNPSYTHYAWDYDDGVIDTTYVNATVNHIYQNWETSTPERKTVRLTTFNSHDLNGGKETLVCSSFVEKELLVNPAVEARFTGPVEGCSPFEAQFISQSRGTATKFDWDFGDGQTDASANTKNIFTNTINNNQIIDFPVTLTASNSWCSHHITNNFRLYPQPVARFTVDPVSGCQPLPVVFTNTSTGNTNNTRYYYDFGDGETQVLNNTNSVTNIYKNTMGADLNLTSTLTARNAFLGLNGDSVRCVSFPATDKITVLPYIEAGFSATPVDVNRCSPLDVRLFNSSKGFDKYEYTWEGNGNHSGDRTESVVQNIELTADNMYQDKTYKVLLTVTMGKCSDTVSHKILVNASPVADFTPGSPYPQPFPYPAPSIPINNLIPTPDRNNLFYQWSWNEHGNSISSFFSTEVIPSRLTISDWGRFDIVQQVVSANGVCFDTKRLTIEIASPTPIPEFEDVLAGCAPYDVQFNNTSRHARSYLWEFDDGYTSTDVDPFHSFKTAGIYNVKLTVFGDNMTAISKTKQVTVHPAPQAGFELRAEQLYVGIPVNTWNYTKHETDVWYSWDWGDGSPADTTQAPSHKYLRPGTYDVTLTACSFTEPECCSTYPILKAITIEDNGDIVLPNIFIPNPVGEPSDVIPPDGVNRNYLFFPNLLNPTKKYQMYIYNRAGILLYKTNDPNKGWNGYYKGRICSEDVYIYRIEGIFENGASFVKIGDITLIR